MRSTVAQCSFEQYYWLLIRHTMTTSKVILGVVVILAVGFLGGYIYSSLHTSSVGGVMVPTNGMYAENYNPYIRTEGGFLTNYPIKTNSDLTVSGGSIVVTTSNTATSTLVAGCYQFYATSTATALKFQASTTPGIMYSQYGTCPNL